MRARNVRPAGRGAAADKAPVIDLLSGYSTEVLPREREKIAAYRDLLPAGASVYIAFLPGNESAEIVAAAVELRRAGFNPVPHVTARGTTNRAELEDYLSRLAGEAGVVQMLLIGGDRDRPKGEFDRSMQLLETGLFDKYGIARIGLAGHPEGSPVIAPEALFDALARKNAFARRTDAELYLVTQFCFEAAPIVAWERAVREHGNRLPVRVGLPGVTTARSLIAYARRCGVGPSLRALTRHRRSLAKLASIWTPDGLIAELAHHRVGEPGCAIEGIHLFSFGARPRTAEWARAILDGRFELRADGKGLVVESRR